LDDFRMRALNMRARDEYVREHGDALLQWDKVVFYCGAAQSPYPLRKLSFVNVVECVELASRNFMFIHEHHTGPQEPVIISSFTT
jgi:hypothetical protein